MKSHHLKQVFEYMSPHLRSQIFGFFFTLLYSVSLFLTPLISRYLVDHVIGMDSLSGIITGVSLFCLVCMAQPLTSYIKDVIFIKIGEETAVDIRKSMYSGVLYASLREIEKRSTGEIISRISQDGYMASRVVSELAVGIIKNLMISIMIVIGLLVLSPMLSIISISLFLFSMVLTSRMSRSFETIQAEVQKNQDDLSEAIDQMVTGLGQTKSFELEPKFELTFDSVLQSVKHINTKAMIHSARIQNVSSAIMVIILCVLYGGGSILVMLGQMTIGTVIGLGLYFQLLTQPVYELMHQKSAIHKAVPILDRIEVYKTLNVESSQDITIRMNENTKINSSDTEYLVLDHLYFAFGDTDILNGVTMRLPSKGLAVIEGRSGCGKTTLLNILSGLYYADAGGILLDGRTVSPKNLRSKVAYVEQQPKVYDCIQDKLSKRDVVLTEKEVNFIEGLKRSFIDSDKKNTHSGGEAQRQAMINAVYKQTPILILDEPLSALDDANKLMMLKHIKFLAEEKLVIVVSHDLIWQENASVFYDFKDNGSLLCRKYYVDGGNIQKSV